MQHEWSKRTGMNSENERMELKHVCYRMRNVIRSLREDVQVSHGIDERVRVVRRSRRERMVAHDIADAPFPLPIETCRRTLFEKNSLVMFFMM